MPIACPRGACDDGRRFTYAEGENLDALSLQPLEENVLESLIMEPLIGQVLESRSMEPPSGETLTVVVNGEEKLMDPDDIEEYNKLLSEYYSAYYEAYYQSYYRLVFNVNIYSDQLYL